MNYSIVVEYDDTTDVMPWGPGTLKEALEMRDRYVSVLTDSYTGARRVYIMFGERIEVTSIHDERVGV